MKLFEVTAIEYPFNVRRVLGRASNIRLAIAEDGRKLCADIVALHREGALDSLLGYEMAEEARALAWQVSELHYLMNGAPLISDGEFIPLNVTTEQAGKGERASSAPLKGGAGDATTASDSAPNDPASAGEGTGSSVSDNVTPPQGQSDAADVSSGDTQPGDVDASAPNETQEPAQAPASADAKASPGAASSPKKSTKKK